MSAGPYRTRRTRKLPQYGHFRTSENIEDLTHVLSYDEL